MRQPLLYARELWNRNWLMAPLAIVGSIGVGLFSFSNARSRAGLPLLLGEGLFFALAVLLIFGFYRRQSWAEVGNDVVRLHWPVPFRNFALPFEAMRSVRVAPLQGAFAETRARMVNPTIKPLLEKPALWIRMDPENPATIDVTRRLGRRYCFDGAIVLPMPDPQKFAQEVQTRLPRRFQTQNLGGQRRSRRRS